MGIVVSGLAATALVHQQVPATWGWAAFGLLAALMTAGVWRVFDTRRAQPAAPPAPGPAGAGPAPAHAGAAEMALFTLAYGLAGVGYIITATYFAMQEVRRVRPQQATPFMGLLTAAYGLGQVAGPPMAAWLVGRSASAAEGFATSLWLATGLLLLGSALYLLIWWRHPAR